MQQGWLMRRPASDLHPAMHFLRDQIRMAAAMQQSLSALMNRWSERKGGDAAYLNVFELWETRYKAVAPAPVTRHRIVRASRPRAAIRPRTCSRMRVLKPFDRQDERKPRWTMGRVRLHSRPRFGGCATCHA